jgi:hypothetical protein
LFLEGFFREYEEQWMSEKDLESHFTKLEDKPKAIKLGLEAMEEQLAQKSASMETFWKLKREVFPLFKASFAQIQKQGLWGRYQELIEEAKKLANFRKADAAFDLEQIRISINHMEDKWQAIASVRKNRFAKGLSPYLAGKDGYLNDYKTLYMEMEVVGPLTHEVAALNKELAATSAAFGAKKALFATLSSFGDAVFGRRKELTRKAQELLEEDLAKVESMVEALEKPEEGDLKEFDGQLHLHFKLFKAVQFAMKHFYVQGSFRARWKERLNTMWEKLAGFQEEGKKRLALREQGFEEAKGEALKAFSELEKKAENLDSDSLKVLQKELSQFNSEWDAEKIGLRGVKQLAKEQEGLQEKIKAFILAEKQAKIEQRKKRFEELVSQVEAIISSERELSRFEEQLEPLLSEGRAFASSIQEEKLWQRLEFMAEAERISLKELEPFEEYRERRRLAAKIKEQLDHDRKQMGSSYLDIEKGLVYQEHRKELSALYNEQVAVINRLGAKIV